MANKEGMLFTDESINIDFVLNTQKVLLLLAER